MTSRLRRGLAAGSEVLSAAALARGGGRTLFDPAASYRRILSRYPLAHRRRIDENAHVVYPEGPVVMDPDLFLTDAQLAAGLARCVYCEEKPCTEASPAHCSPADFIMAARGMTRGDIARSAALIMTRNPLGGEGEELALGWGAYLADPRRPAVRAPRRTPTTLPSPSPRTSS